MFAYKRFCTREIFLLEKKVNRLEIVFIASIHYTTNHYGRD